MVWSEAINRSEKQVVCSSMQRYGRAEDVTSEELARRRARLCVTRSAIKGTHHPMVIFSLKLLVDVH